MRWIVAITLALFTAGTSFGATHQSAMAQYPSPTGSLTLTSDQSSPIVGLGAALTVTFVDVDGHPLIGVPITVSITTQPGSDAGLSPEGFQSLVITTDKNGQAFTSFKSGGTPGLVILTAAGGGKTSTLVLNVQAP